MTSSIPRNYRRGSGARVQIDFAKQHTHVFSYLAEMLRLVCVVAASWLAIACAYKEVYPPVDSNASTTPLYLALMMSFGGGFNSSGTVPAIKIALDRVNQDPSLLPGYSLHYTLLDSQVSARVRGKREGACALCGQSSEC